MDETGTPAVPAGVGANPGAPRGRIAFCCVMNALDPDSGAAISVRSILEALAAAGHEVSSFSASIFDPNGEVSFRPALGREAAKPENRGKVLHTERNGVSHRVFLTASSQRQNLTEEEKQRIAARWAGIVEEAPPDIVFTFGSSELLQTMLATARAAGARIVHYLANAERRDAAAIQPEDALACPSEFLQGVYRGVLGRAPEVIRSILPEDRWLGEGEPAIAARPTERRLGLVSFFNPIPQKGLTLVGALALRAERECPDMRFLVTEGRMPRSRLQQINFDLGALPNVWFVPTQHVVREVYRRTAVLLVPSFWREGFSRSVLEAQLSGIPVIASTQGGLPEALNGGGFALDLPETLLAKHTAAPDRETVDRWWETLRRLWEDEAAYAEAAARARRTGAAWHPDRIRPRIVGHFERILAERA
jgi:glycosyltransferase involved in cell wall biosynthesis